MWLTPAQKPTPNSHSQFSPPGITGSSCAQPVPSNRIISGTAIAIPASEVCNCIVTGCM